MLCHLTGLKEPSHAINGPLGGVIFETAVLSELVKSFVNRGKSPEIYFWRTVKGEEVDFVIPSQLQLVPIEVKLSSTLSPKMAAGIQALRRDLGDKIAPGFILYPGREVLPVAAEVTGLPFALL